ncbi:hypothetical protein X474_03630 [Dethiosulfatarculus sandiegensis]|uniref:Uncharacterized protein n=1 Tax=Dethiosulfatarculus sandiegensis TaxID=1429043 RepID=A0A0D2JBA9_9BACT|nr:hypothetical protein X474_03630 [Dethiosulfatarculus sandiegensis]
MKPHRNPLICYFGKDFPKDVFVYVGKANRVCFKGAEFYSAGPGRNQGSTISLVAFWGWVAKKAAPTNVVFSYRGKNKDYLK